MSDRVNDKEQLVDEILKIKGASLGDNEEGAGRIINLTDKKQHREFRKVIGRDPQTSLSKFRELKYNNSK